MMASASSADAKAVVVNFCAPQSIVTITVTSADSKDQTQSKRPRAKRPEKGETATRESSFATQALAKREPATSTFFIHKNILCQNSPFFDAAFNGDFMEGASQAMTFDDVDDCTFGVVVNWFYNQEISDIKNEVPNLCTLAKVWILAERFLMPKLQNAVMDQIYIQLKDGIGCDHFGDFVHIAYNHGDGKGVLGNIMRAALVWCSAEELKVHADNLPHKLVLQLIPIFKFIQRKQSRQVLVAEKFHVAV